MSANYDYSEQAIADLIEWFKDKTLPQEVYLDKATHVYDVRRFIDANVSDIQDHYPDPFFNASIDRLYKLKSIMEEA